MINTEKTSLLLTDHLAVFPCDAEVYYKLSYAGLSGYGDTLIPDSVRVVKVRYVSERQQYFIVLKTLSLKLFLSGKALKHSFLGEHLASVYDELVLRSDPNGKILGINNMQAIWEQWGNVKEKIMDEYQGREIYRLIKGFNMKFSNEKLILEELQQYQFFGLLLKPIYQKYEGWTDVMLEKDIPTLAGNVHVEERLRLHDKDMGNEKVWILLRSLAPKHEGSFRYEGYYELNTARGHINQGKLSIVEELGSRRKVREILLNCIEEWQENM